MSTRLKLYLNQIKGGREREIKDTLPAAEWADMLEGFEGYAASGAFEYALVARKLKHSVVIEGWIRATLTTTCGRCAKDFEEPCGADVRTVYMERPKGLNEEELELTAEDLELSFYVGDNIDLRDFLRESLVLELSAYPSCQLSSEGLCPIFGHDPKTLFDESAKMDPPPNSWKAGLEALKDKLKS